VSQNPNQAGSSGRGHSISNVKADFLSMYNVASSTPCGHLCLSRGIF
jgi:hypothetical protein